MSLHSGNDSNVENDICEEFESAWNLEQHPKIEQFLNRVASAEREKLLVRLMRLEYGLCDRGGIPFPWDEFERRFPDQVDQLREFQRDLALTVAGDVPRGSTAFVSPEDESDPSLDRGRLGDYELISQIGRGGMGVVYKARHVDLDRLFAIKVLPVATSLEPSARSRFQIEAKAAAQLEHPHIVQVYAFGIQDGTYYYAMQYIDGGNLSELIRDVRDHRSQSGDTVQGGSSRGTTKVGSSVRSSHPGSTGSLNLLEAASGRHPTTSRKYLEAFARIGIQVSDALHYAHVMGIVHRDIKPSNLLVDPNGEVFISDFGLARVQGESELTAPGNIVGTLRYMSPEQAYAQRIVVDHRTDVFSLGATLYELLLLRYAFDGKNKAEILRQIAFHDPTPPRKVSSRIPEDLETIVLKCLAKNPDERYESAAAVAADLRSWLNDDPIAARPPSLLQRGVKWAKRHRVAIQSAAAILLIGIFSLFSALAFAVQTEKAARQKTEAKNAELTAALNESEGRRMAAVASLELPRNPSLASSLAAAGLERHSSIEGRDTLLAALDANHEEHLFRQPIEAGMALFHPDGKSLLVVPAATFFDSDIKTPARLYDLESGEVVHRLDETRTITSAAFTRDGARLLSATGRGDSVDALMSKLDQFTVSVWDTERGTKISELPDAALLRAHSRSICPVGEQTLIVAPAEGNLARVYNAAGDIHRTFRGHTDHVNFAAFGPLGARVVTAGYDQTIRVWDVESEREVIRLDEWSKRAQAKIRSMIQYVEFGPDEKQIITVSKLIGVELWDLETRTAKSLGPGTYATFSPDGQQIAVVNYKRIRFFDARTLALISETPQQIREISHIDFSPDSRLVLTCTSDNSVRIWDTQSGQMSFELRGHEGPARHASFSPNGNRVASASDDATARTWHTKSGAEREQFAAVLGSRSRLASVSSDSERVVFATESKISTTIFDDQLDATDVTFSQSATGFDRNGKHFCTYDANSVVVREAESGRELARFHRRLNQINGVLLSPNGNSVAISSIRGPTWLWHWSSNVSNVLLESERSTNAMQFHPADGKLVTAGIDGIVRTWNTTNGESIASCTIGRISPQDSRNTADGTDSENTGSAETAGRTETASRDEDPGEDKATIETTDRSSSPLIRIRDVAYSPDGSKIVVVLQDSQAPVFDSESLEEVARITSEGIRFDLAVFSASSKRIVTLDMRGGTQYCWDAANGTSAHQIEITKDLVRLTRHPSQDRMLFYGRESGIHEWDLETGEIVRHIEGRYSAAVYRPEDDSILAASEQPMLVIPKPSSDDQPVSPPIMSPRLLVIRAGETEIEEEKLVSHGSLIKLDFCERTGRSLVRQRHFGLDVCDTATKQTIGSIRAHGAPITFVGRTPSDNAIVTCSWDGSVIMWDANSRKPVRELIDDRGPIVAAAMSTDGKLLAAAKFDGLITVWDLESGEQRQVLRGLDARVVGCSFGAFGSRLVAYDRERNWKLWDIATGDSIATPDMPIKMRDVAFQPNGSTMFYRPMTRKVDGDDKSEQKPAPTSKHPVMLRLRDGRTVELPLEFPARFIRFSPSGNSLLTIAGRAVTEGDVLTVWDASTGKKKLTISKPRVRLLVASVDQTDETYMTLHSNGVTAWDASGAEIVNLIDDRGFLNSHSLDYFTPDGRFVFAVTIDDHLRTSPVDPLQSTLKVRPLGEADRLRFHVKPNDAVGENID